MCTLNSFEKAIIRDAIEYAKEVTLGNMGDKELELFQDNFRIDLEWGSQKALVEYRRNFLTQRIDEIKRKLL